MATPDTPSQRYASFAEFYPYYLREHRDPTCRRLHVIGSALVIVCLAVAIFSRNAWLLIGLPIIGYGFAWIGHYVFEKNRPATFTYPLYSLMGDWAMFGEVLSGKRPF